MLVRPWRVNEAWWASGGALALVAARALSPHDAAAALARGLHVYLFLIGMMALAEFARTEGVFGWVASRAVQIVTKTKVGSFSFTRTPLLGRLRLGKEVLFTTYL